MSDHEPAVDLAYRSCVQCQHPRWVHAHGEHCDAVGCRCDQFAVRPADDTPAGDGTAAERRDRDSAEAYIKACAKSWPDDVQTRMLVRFVEEYDRRGTELVELRGKLDTVLIGHSYDTAMQEGERDDWKARHAAVTSECIERNGQIAELQNQRWALSSLLRGMARRVSSWRETANVLLDLGGPELAATIRDLNATDEAGSVDLRELSRAVAAGAVPPATAGIDWAQVSAGPAEAAAAGAGVPAQPADDAVTRLLAAVEPCWAPKACEHESEDDCVRAQLLPIVQSAGSVTTTPDPAAVDIVWDHRALAYAVKVLVPRAPALLTHDRYWDEPEANAAADRVRAALAGNTKTKDGDHA